MVIVGVEETRIEKCQDSPVPLLLYYLDWKLIKGFASFFVQSPTQNLQMGRCIIIMNIRWLIRAAIIKILLRGNEEENFAGFSNYGVA